MIIQNLTQENVEQLQSVLSDMQQVNPDIIFRVFEKNTGTPPDAFLLIELAKVKRDVESIKNKLDLIFGNAVLINGQFKDINQTK